MNSLSSPADGAAIAAASGTETPKPTPRILAIAGASGSGKTFLATHLAKELGAQVLSIDSYYRDLAHLTLGERAQWNFDHPDSLDWPLLRAQLARLREGIAVETPVYDFATHTRSGDTRRIDPGAYVILEGIFALYDAEVRAMVSHGIFVEYRDAGCLDRRMARDVAERGRTPACVLAQYQSTVRPMFQEFIAPTRAFADLVLAGDNPVEESMAAVRRLTDCA